MCKLPTAITHDCFFKIFRRCHKFLKHNLPTLAAAHKAYFVLALNTRVFWTIVLVKFFKRIMERFAVRVKIYANATANVNFFTLTCLVLLLFTFLLRTFTLCQIEITNFIFGKLRNYRCKNLDFPIT
jgi:hypothetical protein